MAHPNLASGHRNAFEFRGDVVVKNTSQTETDFYQELFAADLADPTLLRMRGLVPQFYGVDESCPTAVLMENLTKGMAGPSIFDLKLGARTSYRRLGADCDFWHATKSKLCTSFDLGFRISGLILRNEAGEVVETWPKHHYVLMMGDEGSKDPLRRLVSVDGAVDTEIARQLHSKVQPMLDFFNEQRVKHFTSMSLLLLVDKPTRKTEAKLIDFNHANAAEGQLDTSKD
jgi:hypothetical protein